MNGQTQRSRQSKTATATAQRALGQLLALGVTVALATPLVAQERAIPVRPSKAGTLNTSGKRKVKAGGGAGVFKRGAGKLDPAYDPASATDALDADGGGATQAPRNNESTRITGNGGAGSPGSGGGDGGDEGKKIEDSVTWKTNF